MLCLGGVFRFPPDLPVELPGSEMGLCAALHLGTGAGRGRTGTGAGGGVLHPPALLGTWAITAVPSALGAPRCLPRAAPVPASPPDVQRL